MTRFARLMDMLLVYDDHTYYELRAAVLALTDVDLTELRDPPKNLDDVLNLPLRRVIERLYALRDDPRRFARYLLNDFGCLYL